MKRDPLADSGLAFYPGLHLPEAERRRVDALDLGLEELTPDHIVYSLGRYIETSFANTYTVAADVVGEEQAQRIAREAGRRHGGGGYARLLAANGTPGAGDPRLMARYQDLAHAIRGPKHARALFAEFDDERCVVTKAECGFYDTAWPEAAPYVAAFETGCFEGYRAADRNLAAIEVRCCRWRGDGGCEIHFVWHKDPSPPTGQP